MPIPPPRRWWSSHAPPVTPAYCCYGCRLAEEIAQSTGPEAHQRVVLARIGFAVFFSMNVFAFSMVLWTQDQARGGIHDSSAELAAALWSLFRYLCMLFALPVLMLLGLPLTEAAVKSLRAGRYGTDLLMLAGVAASYAYSTVHVFTDSGHVYFEVGCAILILVTLGRWLEAVGRQTTVDAVRRLRSALPETARLVGPTGETTLPAESLVPGQAVRVLPGESIPCDGKVMQNIAAVDERLLSGESRPANKRPGDEVFGGTIVLDAPLLVEVTSPFRGGLLQRLTDLVENAGASRGRYVRLADRMSAVFLPTIGVLAVVAVVLHSRRFGLEIGIQTGLAVVVIACPCSLGLATSLAIWSAMGLAARHQVLFRSAEAMERLATVRAVRFDKTGTLTTSEPAVLALATSRRFPVEPEWFLQIAAALSESSVHPYSRAIAGYCHSPERIKPPAAARYDPCIALADIRLHPGLGIEATLIGNGQRCRLGSLAFLRAAGIVCDEPMLLGAHDSDTSSGSACCLAVGDRWLAVFVISERLRPEAVDAIAALRKAGLDVAVLTGDRPDRAAAMARQLHVPVLGGMLPEQKVAAVADAQSATGPTAMIGDGVNDAAALAQSDVGIALGCGADLTRESADICLIGDDLSRIGWTLGLSRQAVRVIKQNLFWAFAYNAVAIPWAMAGRLDPIIAALAMVASSVSVVGNSMRLSRFRPGGD